MGGATVLGAHDTGNRITPWGSATFGHDADGNRTSKTVSGVTTTYGLSANGRLTSVSSGGTTLGYDCTAAGQPVRRAERGDGAVFPLGWRSLDGGVHRELRARR